MANKMRFKNKRKFLKPKSSEGSEESSGNESEAEEPVVLQGNQWLEKSTAFSSRENENESDSENELQAALKAGLLQENGLNVITAPPRQCINKKSEMEQKLFQMKKKREWLATLDVEFKPEFTYTDAISNDIEREATFLKQAQDAASIALPRLSSANVPIFRPADYFAEMAKSDAQMHKVRKRLNEINKVNEKKATSRRLRDEKKFAVQVQKVQKERKMKEKKVFLEAVKKHRKGMKAQLETMLNNATTLQAEQDDEGPTNDNNRRNKNFKVTRNARDKKYGFGGQKKRSKKNDKESFESAFSGSKWKQAGRGGKFSGGGRGGAKSFGKGKRRK